MQKQNIEYLQSRFFGDRFVGATLAKVSLDERISRQMEEWMKDCHHFLVMVGPPGVGKTYLCAALLECIPRSCVTIRAYSERKLLERLRQGISSQKGDYLAHLHDLIDDDLIIIDDIASSGHNEWREEIIMEALDYRYKDGKPTVLTSNLGWAEIKHIYGERIASRMFSKQNKILDLSSMPDLRQQGL